MIHEIFEEYREKKEEIEISISQLKNDLGNFLNNIVLYGAGSAGIAFLFYLRDIGIHPKFFADGNSNRWGTVCEGLPVIAYKDIVKMAGENVLVIVTINTDGKKYCKSFDDALRAGGHTGVHKKLKESGCKNVIDYTYFRRCSALFHGDKYNLPSCSDVNLMEQHEKEICETYDILSDNKSKEVLEKIVTFRMLDDGIQVPTENQEKQYFEYTIFPKIQDEIFVDCGAYNGISLKMFLKENNYHFRKYYGVEPDRSNFAKLKEYASTLPKEIQDKTVLVNKAVYNTAQKVKLFRLEGPGSFVADIGKQETDTVKVDNLIGQEGATYIKMNIEGSELPALLGAERTIKQYTPRLAIAGYHKTWDLWEIPQLLHSMNPFYKIYLRSYMNHISFVYYCV